MLKITPQQFDVFQNQAEDAFIQSLKKALADKYPHLLPSFPDAIQTQIVINMLSRARRWGITWQSSLVIFSELMVAIAPNFDEEAEIRQVFKHHQQDVNTIMKTVTQYVSEKSWHRAEAASDDLPLFLTTEYLNAPLVEKTASAIPFVLWDKVDEIDVDQYAKNACQYVTKLGLGGLNDAPLTVIVWRCLYGKNFNNPSIYPWINDVMSNKRQPREIIAMLKFRIALDHRRIV